MLTFLIKIFKTGPIIMLRSISLFPLQISFSLASCFSSLKCCIDHSALVLHCHYHSSSCLFFFLPLFFFFFFQVEEELHYGPKRIFQSKWSKFTKNAGTNWNALVFKMKRNKGVIVPNCSSVRKIPDVPTSMKRYWPPCFWTNCCWICTIYCTKMPL